MSEIQIEVGIPYLYLLNLATVVWEDWLPTGEGRCPEDRGDLRHFATEFWESETPVTSLMSLVIAPGRGDPGNL